MIKKYKQFNEGITQYLKGPTKEEYTNYLLDKAKYIKSGAGIRFFSSNIVTKNPLPEIIKDKLIELTNVYMTKSVKYDLLCVFVKNCIKEGVDILIKKGADVDFIYSLVVDCVTAYNIEKYFPIIKDLVEIHNIDVNTKNRNLLYKLVYDKSEINNEFDNTDEYMSYLLKHGADPKLINKDFVNNDEYISYLLDHGANPKLINNNGFNMLLPIYRLGNDVVIKIIESGYDFHIDRYTFLEYYVASNNMDMVKYLISRGIDVKYLSTAILKAAKTSKSPKKGEMIKFITSLLNTNEGITQFLKGPSKEEMWSKMGLGDSAEEAWKSVGYDETFETQEDFFQYLIKDLTPIKNERWNRIDWVRDNKIFIEHDKANNNIVLDANDWYVFNKIFGMDNLEISRFIVSMIIKYDIKKWKKTFITYGNINQK